MPDLHDRLDALFGGEPPRSPVDVHLTNGHRALRRRRAAFGVGALAAVLIVGGAGHAVQGHTGEAASDHVANQAPTATPEPDPDAQVLDACRTGRPKEDAGYLWKSGTPEVMATVETWNGYTDSWLRSADGRYWGECITEKGEAAFVHASRNAQDPRLAPSGYSYGAGPACDPDKMTDPDCRRFVASTQGRRDPAVATIEVRFFDGKWEKVDTNEGYYFVEHTGRLPDDITWSPDGMPLRGGDQIDDVINRIRLLDANGDLLAYWDSSQNRNGLNAPNGKDVAEIEAYPEIQSRDAGPAGDRAFP